MLRSMIFSTGKSSSSIFSPSIKTCLLRNLKKYIKTASCYPERCSKVEYHNIMKDFNTSEKVWLTICLLFIFHFLISRSMF